MYRELNVGFTPEQATMRRAAHEFARDVLRPAGRALDRLPDPAAAAAPGSPLWSALRAAYGLGYHRALLPAAAGGLGLDGFEQHLLLEELGWGNGGLGVAIGVCGFPFALLARTGDTELIERFVRPFVADGEAGVIGCWAITEPQHGSDQLVPGTPEFHDPRITGEVVARRDGDAWVLRGQKAAWVSNGTIATHALVYLTVDPRRGMAGGGIALVPLDLPGVSRGRPLDKLGQRALNQGEIFFDDVRIPARHLIATPELYEAALDGTLALANAGMGAIFTGVARAAFETALAYSRTRVQGGKPICEHQLVQKRLFDMFCRVEAARALSRAALAYNHATFPPATEYSIAAKTFCTEAAFAVADSAVQLLGGNGLAREYAAEQLFRDARAALIEDGSNDVLALVAARRLLAAEAALERAA